MLLENERRQMREVFFNAWHKYKNNIGLDPLEKQIISVVLAHPEYHKLLDDREHNLDKDYFAEFGDTNPFLHLALHVSFLEQLSTNRPFGIRDIYQKLCTKLGSKHEAEHKIVNCIAENIWRAQRFGKILDDNEYLTQLNLLLN